MPHQTYQCPKCSRVLELESDLPPKIRPQCPNPACKGAPLNLKPQSSGLYFFDEAGKPTETFDSRENFTEFTCLCVLKRYALSAETIRTGFIAEKRRAGIDAIYLIVQGSLVLAEGDAERLFGDWDNPRIELVVVRATREGAFIPLRIRKMRDVLTEAVRREENGRNENGDDKPVAPPAGDWTDPLFCVVRELFALANLDPRHPPLIDVRYYYISRGDASAIDAPTRNAADDFIAATKLMIPSVGDVRFKFISERDLIA